MIKKYGGSLGITVFGLSLVTTDISVETEALVFDFTALVSNVGGSLGLFLGFSFYMLWDWIVYLYMMFKSGNRMT